METLVVCKIQAQKVLPKKTNKTSDHAGAEDNVAIAEAQLNCAWLILNNLDNYVTFIIKQVLNTVLMFYLKRFYNALVY